MNEKKNILIVVPDGTGIKNYLYARLFRETNHVLTLLHNFDDDTLNTITRNVPIQNSKEIPRYKEGVREKFIRELIHLARLKFNSKKAQNPTILNFWKKNRKSFKLKLFYSAVVLASKFVRSYNAILWLERKYERALKENSFFGDCKALFEEMQPDVVFCTHQRALKAPTLFAAARELNIPTKTVIYSWDNLPKARLALKANTYLVWSEHMKEELSYFYPEIDPMDIKVTGTPQFEFFFDSNNRISKDDFYKTYGLDPAKKLICFSGDDVRTSPYDPEYLNDLAEAISAEQLENMYTVLFRRCPVDLSGRYDWVLEKFPDLIVETPPLWNHNSERWTAIYPTIDDVKLLVSTAYYADVVINVGSTMAFDFGMFEKPCIYINYDHSKDQNWSVDTVYRYQHFRSMPSKKAVYWFNDREEIVSTLQQALQFPNTEIRRWQEVIANHLDTASERILKELV